MCVPFSLDDKSVADTEEENVPLKVSVEPNTSFNQKQPDSGIETDIVSSKCGADKKDTPRVTNASMNGEETVSRGADNIEKPAGTSKTTTDTKRGGHGICGQLQRVNILAKNKSLVLFAVTFALLGLLSGERDIAYYYMKQKLGWGAK